MSLVGRELTEREIWELERLAGSRVEEARLVERAGIVLAASRTHHMCDVVRAMNTDKHTVRRWVDRYLAEGLPGLRDRPRSGAPCTFTRAQRSRVVELALTAPESLGLPFGVWTRKRLSDYVLEQEGFRMSETHIGELLHKEGLRWKQQESWFTETLDPAFAEKRGPSSNYTKPHRKTRLSHA